MSRDTGLPVDVCTAIGGMAVGVQPYPKLEEHTQRVLAYIKDTTVLKDDGTVDKLPLVVVGGQKYTLMDLTIWAVGGNETTVRAIMGDAAGVKGEHLDARTLRKVYRKTREPKRPKIESLDWCTGSFCTMLRDFHVQPHMIADILEVYKSPPAEELVRGVVYKWQSPEIGRAHV
jgi:hypothetical protein